MSASEPTRHAAKLAIGFSPRERSERTGLSQTPEQLAASADLPPESYRYAGSQACVRRRRRSVGDSFMMAPIYRENPNAVACRYRC